MPDTPHIAAQAQLLDAVLKLTPAGIAALTRASKKTGNIEVVRLPALIINLQDNNF
jgi:hypothetical protein